MVFVRLDVPDGYSAPTRVTAGCLYERVRTGATGE
jgi:hypothetical protein